LDANIRDHSTSDSLLREQLLQESLNIEAFPPSGSATKYNLLTLPVVDEEQRLIGIITADDIISLLRDRA
jgi:CBS domain-containing protein